MADAELYMATDRFVDHRSGAPVVVPKGATARAGHPIIAAFPTLWVPLQVDYEVEAKPAAKATRRGGE